MQSIRLTISGKVQGVGYRKWFRFEANKLNLKGYVKNLDNGKVEATLVGDEKNIVEMIKLSYVGPTFAEVLDIQQQILAHNVSCEEYLALDGDLILSKN